MSSSMYLRLALLTHERDIAHVAALETTCYPANEAATISTIQYRQQNAGPYFWAAYLPTCDHESKSLVGFINGTLTSKDQLDKESMRHHDPHGSLLCIHSVVIDPAFRRQGLASQMLKQYVRLMCDGHPHVKHIMLIAKAHLLHFYVRCGFAVTRLSSVVHGADPWFELELDCDAARLPRMIQVNAFTSEAFQGNPAAVVVLSPTGYHKTGASAWMQRVATEHNVSETAFVASRERTAKAFEGVAEYDLRWFTPGNEVKVSGHATLSTALALLDAQLVTTSQTLHFHTLSGVLMCRFETEPNTRKQLVLLDFPEQPPEPVDSSIVWINVAFALGLPPAAIVDIKQATTDLLVHVTPEAFVRLKPDFVELAKTDVRGFAVTAEIPKDIGSGVDIQSRFFAPRIGVNEDPVTGSAHCALCPYWAPLLKKTTIKAQQFSPLRGGYLTLDLVAAGPGRVLLKGEGVIVLRGKLVSSP